MNSGKRIDGRIRLSPYPRIVRGEIGPIRDVKRKGCLIKISPLNLNRNMTHVFRSAGGWAIVIYIGDPTGKN